MYDFEFGKIFKSLCLNYNKNFKDVQDKYEMFFDKFKYEKSESFEQAINDVCEKSEYFPTIAAVMKSLRAVKPEKQRSGLPDFPYCNACRGMGRAPEIFEIKYTNTGQRIVSRIEENEIKEEIKEYHVFCLCEKGDWLWGKCGSEGIRLHKDRYTELARQDNTIYKETKYDDR